MPKYTVLHPVSYIHDGAAVHQTEREVGDVIELDDTQARPLVQAGALEAVGLTDTEAEADRNAAEGRRTRARKSDDDQSA